MFLVCIMGVGSLPHLILAYGAQQRQSELVQPAKLTQARNVGEAGGARGSAGGFEISIV